MLPLDFTHICITMHYMAKRMDENLVVRVDRETLRRLLNYAKQKKVTKADLVRRAIDGFLDMLEFEEINERGSAIVRSKYRIYTEEDVDRWLSRKRS